MPQVGVLAPVGRPWEGMAHLKQKGDIAELRVAADLLLQGHRVAFPFGEDSAVDLILIRANRCERVQVKYARSDGRTVVVRCRTQSLTGGRVRQTTRYTAATIDWLAVFDATHDRCYHVPAAELGDGMSELTLRLVLAENNQQRRTRRAEEYATVQDTPVEPAGLEPATSSLQKTRSTR